MPARLVESCGHRAFSVAEGDPYAGADLARARRFAALTCGLGGLLLTALLAFGQSGVGNDPAGLVAALASCAFLLGSALVIARCERVGFDALLAITCGSGALLAVVLWRAGGWPSPYDELYLALILNVALTHPIRRALPCVIGLELLALTPLLYDGTGDRLVDVLISLWLWTAAALFCVRVMAEIRLQRIWLADRSDRAVDEARRDALTGLPNRRAFDESLAARLARARTQGRPLCLAIGDIDDFKDINDRHGHLAGDAVLAGVGGALAGAARGGDRVFRWAGDEFAVILEGVEPHRAQAICARLEDAVAHAVPAPDGRPVAISIGWAADDGEMPTDALVARADGSMLERKAGGRAGPLRLAAG